VFWFWDELVFCVRVRVVFYGNKKENIFSELRIVFVEMVNPSEVNVHP
jgi:hypothetical protein